MVVLKHMLNPAAFCPTANQPVPPHRYPVAVLLNLKGRVWAARGARQRWALVTRHDEHHVVAKAVRSGKASMEYPIDRFRVIG